MKIKKAEHLGFCFGVNNAINLAENALSQGKLMCYGEIVHNPQENERLKKMGLLISENMHELSHQNRILVRAHGILKEEKDFFDEHGVEMLDATCPIVKNIHKVVAQKEKNGYNIVIVGNSQHPEVRGISSYLEKKHYIVNSIEEAEAINNQDSLFVISQTTNRFEKFEAISKIIYRNNSHVEIQNTICNATRLRQESCKRLAKEVDAVIILGGYHSSNTQKLVEVANKYCENIFFVEQASEIPLHILRKFNTIGITAGASTPSWLIEEVIRRMDQFSNEELMEEMEGTFTSVRAKEIVKGKIIYVTDNEVMVNIGYKSDGIIKQDELSDEPGVSPKDLFKEGEEIEVYVIKLDDGEGNVVLSSRRVARMKNWEVLAQMFENHELVDATVVKEVKGGLIATVMGINGFIPGSQLASYFIKDLKPYIDQVLKCEIIGVDARKRRLVLSRKSVLEAEQKEIEEKVWENIEVGSMVTGTVARITDFGAFVNLGGVDGLLHISDISWNRIDHPKDVLNIGDEVTLKVLRANRERNRISLGLKQCQPKPFDVFLENNKAGDIVKGTVMNLVPFGAFVKLAEGVEGLVHVSEISYDRVEKPSDELNIGQEVEVKILSVDSENQRIALSIKATKPDERPEVEKPKKEKKPRKKFVQKTVPVVASSQSEDFENIAFGSSVLGDLDFGDLNLELSDVEDNASEEELEETGDKEVSEE